MQRRQNAEMMAAEHRQVIASTNLDLKECKNRLAKECSSNTRLKQELHHFKVSRGVLTMVML